MAARSPFEVFGLKPSFKTDIKHLESLYYELSRALHPDRTARADREIIMKNQQLSAELNQAYVQIKLPENRLETLLRLSGFLKEEASQTQAQDKIPMELAEEFFSIQESGEENEIKAFCMKLENMNKFANDQMQRLALEIEWSDATSPKDAATIKKILDLRKEKSYIASMILNAKKLLEKTD